jgi:hypothetical protein
MTRPKDISDQALTLSLHQLAIRASHNARGILATVLEHCQRVVNVSSDISPGDHSN